LFQERVVIGSRYRLAQINIARMIAPLTDPVMADFVANLAPINALADASPGFVWRFQTEQGDATGVRPYEDDRIIINFSVWESLSSLRDFVFRSAHTSVLKRHGPSPEAFTFREFFPAPDTVGEHA
jgi:hypothetical protein